jgi:hypothetical protein
MTTPPMAGSGVSGSAGITLSPNIKVDLEVAPKDDGDIECSLNCNGQQCKVIYRTSGEIDFDIYPYEST